DGAPREREDCLQVVVGEAELEPYEVVAEVALEDVVDAGQKPEPVDELVARVHAVTRVDLLAEAEDVVHELEAVLQEVEVEADAPRRLLDSEPPDERAEAPRELEREEEGVGRGRRERRV